jgi:hypothetical protein
MEHAMYHIDNTVIVAAHEELAMRSIVSADTSAEEALNHAQMP